MEIVIMKGYRTTQNEYSETQNENSETQNQKCKRFFRKLNKMIFDTEYDDSYLYENNLFYFPIRNVHWGQLKLFYSEFELLLKISKYEKTNDLSHLMFVYVGAAPGDHTPLLLKYFPTMHMLLYDPRRFNEKLTKHERVIIKTGDPAGWFSDNTINEVKTIANNREIVFISDIRREVNEPEILTDMLNQQKWGILLNAKYIFLKLRMPYLKPNEYHLLNYDISQIKNKINKPNENKNENLSDDNLMYLKGAIYSQIYPKDKSTETRLFVKRNENDTYDMTNYSIYQYDKALSYYNLNIRPTCHFYKKSDDQINYILGSDTSYDSVGEYYFWFKYCEMQESNSSNNHINAIEHLLDFSTHFMKETRKNILGIQCKQLFMTIYENINDIRKKNPKFDQLIDDAKIFLTELPSIYAQQLKMIQNAIKNAIETTDTTKTTETTEHNRKVKTKLMKKHIDMFERQSNEIVFFGMDKLIISDKIAKILQINN
jgi:hypothetical protein